MPKIEFTQTEYAITKQVSRSEYPRKVKISEKKIKTKIDYNLPFRVKFLPGVISAYSPTSPAPVGIAIIGVNNYIL